MRATGDHCVEHCDTVGVSLWGDWVRSCGSCEPSRAFINSSLQGYSPEHACWTGRMPRPGGRSSFGGTADGLGKAPRWLDVKGSQFERQRTNSQAQESWFSPTKCAKKVCYFHLLWNLPVNTKQITKLTDFFGNWSKAKCLKRSAVLKVSGVWFGVLNIEHIRGRKRCHLSSAC